MQPQRQPEQLKFIFERPLEDTVEVAIAATMAQCSPETMRRWCDEGRFEAIKLVGRWRIYRKPFLAWIQSRRNQVQLEFGQR
jgi:hypothetical protein